VEVDGGIPVGQRVPEHDHPLRGLVVGIRVGRRRPPARREEQEAPGWIDADEREVRLLPDDRHQLREVPGPQEQVVPVLARALEEEPSVGQEGDRARPFPAEARRHRPAPGVDHVEEGVALPVRAPPCRHAGDQGAAGGDGEGPHGDEPRPVLVPGAHPRTTDAEREPLPSLRLDPEFDPRRVFREAHPREHRELPPGQGTGLLRLPLLAPDPQAEEFRVLAGIDVKGDLSEPVGLQAQEDPVNPAACERQPPVVRRGEPPRDGGARREGDALPRARPGAGGIQLGNRVDVGNQRRCIRLRRRGRSRQRPEVEDPRGSEAAGLRRPLPAGAFPGGDRGNEENEDQQAGQDDTDHPRRR